jgi:SAM-dependent methyltransferase
VWHDEVLISQAFRACPVCEARQIERLRTQRFVLEQDHPLSDGYDVVHCAVCGFVYAAVRASQADYDSFYAKPSKYDDAATSTGSGESAQDRERLAETAAMIQSALRSTEMRVLDIGCATGGLLYALQQRGFRNLVGVDPSPVCARLARDRTGEAYAGWITSMPSQVGTFDCIVMSHVLEHVLDIPGALLSLRPLLRDGARVWIEVPDAVRYADHIYAPFQDFNTEHINHFSSASLDNAMESRGYVAVGGGKRLLHSSAITFTPAVNRVYRWLGSAVPVKPDRTLKPAILRYIERSSALMNSIEESIGNALAAGEEIIVWGAGQLTLKLLAESCLSRARVAAFVDSNPIHHGRRLAGAPILVPAAVRELSQPILVATMLHHREIVAQIQQLGLRNRIILLPEGGPKYFDAAQP